MVAVALDPDARRGRMITRIQSTLLATPAALSLLLFGCGGGATGSTSTGSGGAGGSTSTSTASAGGSTSSAGGNASSSSASASGSGTGGGAPQGTPMFITAGYEDRRLSSLDGTTWSHDISDPPDPGGLDNIGTGIAFGKGLVLVVGHTGAVTSNDGITWTKLPAPLPQKWPGLGGGTAIFANGQFVVVAGDKSYTSPDGVTFKETMNAAPATHWSGIAYGNGKLVAVGDSNSSGGDRKTSDDGETWHDYLEGGPHYHGVAFGNGIFVLVGENGLCLTTTDGSKFDDHTDASLGFDNLAFGNGVFLSCGNAACQTSPDGKTWTKKDGYGPGGRLAFGLGLFVGLSWKSNISTSPDGFTWTKAFSGADPEPALASVAFGLVGQ
jgi:hypothetical protein